MPVSVSVTPLTRTHLRVRLEQQIKILLDGGREGVHFVGRGPIGNRRRLRSQTHVLALYACRCFGNLDRPGGGSLNGARGPYLQ